MALTIQQQQDIVDFLTGNLTVTSSNLPDPYSGADNFAVQLRLNGTLISQTFLSVADGNPVGPNPPTIFTPGAPGTGTDV